MEHPNKKKLATGRQRPAPRLEGLQEVLANTTDPRTRQSIHAEIAALKAWAAAIKCGERGELRLPSMFSTSRNPIDLAFGQQRREQTEVRQPRQE
jgi:hypothetical protein